MLHLWTWERLMIGGIGMTWEWFWNSMEYMGAIKSFNEGSKCCIGIERTEIEWFQVTDGLRQRCIISLWLFITYMDGVVKKVVNGSNKNWSGSRVSGEGRKWEANHLLFVGDKVLVTSSEDKMNEWAGGCEWVKVPAILCISRREYS